MQHNNIFNNTTVLSKRVIKPPQKLTYPPGNSTFQQEKKLSQPTKKVFHRGERGKFSCKKKNDIINSSESSGRILGKEDLDLIFGNLSSYILSLNTSQINDYANFYLIS